MTQPSEKAMAIAILAVRQHDGGSDYAEAALHAHAIDALLAQARREALEEAAVYLEGLDCDPGDGAADLVRALGAKGTT